MRALAALTPRGARTTGDPRGCRRRSPRRSHRRRRAGPAPHRGGRARAYPTTWWTLPWAPSRPPPAGGRPAPRSRHHRPPARRAALEAWLGAPVAYARQVHGREAFVCRPLPAKTPAADALVATGSATALA